MSLSAALLPEFDREMESTRKTLERVPDGKFSWKPHEKSGTMGWLAGHLASIPSWTTITINQDSLDLAPQAKPSDPPQIPPSPREHWEPFDNLFPEGGEALAGA